MRRKVRKPLKSLMLSLMALVTATATLVSASSYTSNSAQNGTIRIEHIWEDNNDAGKTRPKDITETVIQTTNREESEGENTKEAGYLPKGPGDSTDSLPYGSGTIKDPNDKNPDGSTEIKVPSVKDDKNDTTNRNEGYTDGATEAEKVADKTIVKPDFDSEPLPPLGKPIKETYVSSDPEETEREQARLDAEYAEKLAAWESTEEYQQYQTNKEIWDNWNAYESKYQAAHDEALEAYKATLSDKSEDEQKALVEKFEEGFKAAYYNESATTDEQRETAIENIETIRDQLQKTDAAAEEKIDDLSKDIAETVDKLLAGTETENLWSVEGKVDEMDNEKNPLTYDAIMTKETEKALKDAGYESTKLKVTVTLVKQNEDDPIRVYVSVDGGKNWVPADPATREWDETNGTTYNPAEDYVDETVITFLHTLPSNNNNGDDDDDDDDYRDDDRDDDDDDEVIEEPPVPQANVEEPEPEPTPEPEPEPEPEEEMEEPEVPLTEIPATGDSSGLWMLTAMISGAAFLALLKKRDESEEAAKI